jgi:hypothetical protein
MFYDPLLVGITAFLVLIFLLAITVPIGVAMMLCGVGHWFGAFTFVIWHDRHAKCGDL